MEILLSESCNEQNLLSPAGLLRHLCVLCPLLTTVHDVVVECCVGCNIRARLCSCLFVEVGVLFVRLRLKLVHCTVCSSLFWINIKCRYIAFAPLFRRDEIALYVETQNGRCDFHCNYSSHIPMPLWHFAWFNLEKCPKLFFLILFFFLKKGSETIN